MIKVKSTNGYVQIIRVRYNKIQTALRYVSWASQFKIWRWCQKIKC